MLAKKYKFLRCLNPGTSFLGSLSESQAAVDSLADSLFLFLVSCLCFCFVSGSWPHSVLILVCAQPMRYFPLEVVMGTCFHGLTVWLSVSGWWTSALYQGRDQREFFFFCISVYVPKSIKNIFCTHWKGKLLFEIEIGEYFVFLLTLQNLWLRLCEMCVFVSIIEKSLNLSLCEFENFPNSEEY